MSNRGPRKVRTLRTPPSHCSPRLEPGARAFVERLVASDTPPLYLLGYEEARDIFAQLQQHSAGNPWVSVFDLSFPVGPTSRVEVRMVRPEPSSRTLPVIVYLHGGGWVMGSKHTHDRLIRELAIGSDAAVFFVDYSPAPDEQYPQQNEEAYAALTYIATHAAQLNIDASRIAGGGRRCGRQYGRRAHADGEGSPRPLHRPSGAVLSGDRRYFG